jgi:hypothetical protein
VAWTNPKTWSFGEILTSTDMNTYVRDNTEELRSNAANASFLTSGTVPLGRLPSEAGTIGGSNTGGNTFRTVTVTFTAGRFTSTPAVAFGVTGQSGRIASAVQRGTSSSGFTVEIHNQNSSSTTIGGQWFASAIS